jgi:hypothetical protein
MTRAMALVARAALEFSASPCHDSCHAGDSSSVTQTGYALPARSLPAAPGRSRPLPAGDRQASASFAADYAQDSGPDPGNGLAAPGEDHPEPTSATGRADGCQTCTVSVPPRRALAGGRGS